MSKRAIFSQLQNECVFSSYVLGKTPTEIANDFMLSIKKVNEIIEQYKVGGNTIC